MSACLLVQTHPRCSTLVQNKKILLLINSSSSHFRLLVETQIMRCCPDKLVKVFCSWPVVCNKGQAPNSALEMCLEDDGITLPKVYRRLLPKPQSPPPTALARGAFWAKCKCGVFNFHRPPPLWKHDHNWKAALSLPDGQLTYDTWVCSLHLPTLRIGHNDEGVQARLVQNPSNSLTGKRNVATQRDAPLKFPVMCQAVTPLARLTRTEKSGRPASQPAIRSLPGRPKKGARRSTEQPCRPNSHAATGPVIEDSLHAFEKSSRARALSCPV
ncbi:hypothetical protein MTO96_007441 [Rhipicephalus appendiculatus]